MIEQDEQIFTVVANHEEQYSIWPKERDVPAGWAAVGPVGPKGDCLDYIERVWTDMRPRSLRVKDRAVSTGPSSAEVDDGLRSLVRDVLSRHQDRVDEYADGRPELFGWFLAQILTTDAGADLSPDAVRAELTRQLPEQQ